MKLVIMRKDGMKLVDLTRGTAMRERCLNCSCWIPSEVTNCSIKDCPLYPFRSGTEYRIQRPEPRQSGSIVFGVWPGKGVRSQNALQQSAHFTRIA